MVIQYEVVIQYMEVFYKMDDSCVLHRSYYGGC